MGDMVLLNTKNLKQKRFSRKLSHKHAGPYRIEDCVGKQSYRLLLPEGIYIHDVFHMLLLEPYKPREGEAQRQYPLPELIDDKEEWEVEYLLKKEIRNKDDGSDEWYLVKWVGWPQEYNSWASKQDLSNAMELIEDFDKVNPPPHKKRRGKTRKSGI